MTTGLEDWIIKKVLGTMWKKAVVAYFKVSRNLPRETKENNEEYHSEQSVFQPRFETSTSEIKP
jgi:hypothetical protein